MKKSTNAHDVAVACTVCRYANTAKIHWNSCVCVFEALVRSKTFSVQCFSFASTVTSKTFLLYFSETTNASTTERTMLFSSIVSTLVHCASVKKKCEKRKIGNNNDAIACQENGKVVVGESEREDTARVEPIACTLVLPEQKDKLIKRSASCTYIVDVKRTARHQMEKLHR